MALAAQTAEILDRSEALLTSGTPAEKEREAAAPASPRAAPPMSFWDSRPRIFGALLATLFHAGALVMLLGAAAERPADPPKIISVTIASDLPGARAEGAKAAQGATTLSRSVIAAAPSASPHRRPKAAASSSVDGGAAGQPARAKEQEKTANAYSAPVQALIVPPPPPKPAAPAAYAARPSRARQPTAAPSGGVTTGRAASGLEEPALTAARNLADNPRPAYPGLARALGEEGKVILELEVQPNGHAGNVQVLVSSGHSALDNAALAAVRRWRFIPSTRGGIPVASTVRVPVRFALSD